jgi:molybdopterin/thiamine biosynthesis adenylyltransferase
MATGSVESGAVLIAQLTPGREGTMALLGAQLIPVPEGAYEIRTDRSLQITSDGYMHALKTARDRGGVALWVHSHPGDGALPYASKHDRVVNAELADVFADRTESGQYGYLVVSHTRGALTFTGALTGQVEGPITRLAAIGDRWIFRPAYDTEDASSSADLFDRNIRAFGHQIQATISDLTVAVVGCGGTGSAVAEQLTRLGVRSLVLIDPDTLSAPNTTRVYGSTLADVGRPKVEVLGDHLESIHPDVRTTRIYGAVVSEAVARELASVDIAFGCTDDNAGRLRLSRLPYYHLVPLIDCGVQVPADDRNTITGIFGRVTTVYPGASCLICRDNIDLGLAEAEVRSVEEQRQLEKEGYAPALPGVEPAVVAFTTLVAATTVSEFLERLVGYGETPTPTELLLFVHDRMIRANAIEPRPGHYCDRSTDLFGSDRNMYLGLNWAS